jgi:hypothetical protein
MEKLDEEQEETQDIESIHIESPSGSIHETTKAEQSQPTSLIQSLLLEQTEDTNNKKKKKVKTGRQKELVNMWSYQENYSILYSSNIGAFDKINKIYLCIS